MQYLRTYMICEKNLFLLVMLCNAHTPTIDAHPNYFRIFGKILIEEQGKKMAIYFLCNFVDCSMVNILLLVYHGSITNLFQRFLAYLTHINIMCELFVIKSSLFVLCYRVQKCAQCGVWQICVENKSE